MLPFCSLESTTFFLPNSQPIKAKAKSIDMCQNPLTKEYKLDMARRVADPLWTRLDDYLTKVEAGGAHGGTGKELLPFKEALQGAFVATAQENGEEEDREQGKEEEEEEEDDDEATVVLRHGHCQQYRFQVIRKQET